MKKLMMIAAIAFVVGCSQQPTVQTGPDAEKTFDGLVRVDNARFSNVWVDPDIDFSHYNKVIPGGAEFEFRAVQKTSGTTRARSNEREFWISDADRQRLIDTVTEVFNDELSRSQHFTMVEEPGPDTLILVGALHDIVSRVPPEQAGRTEVWLNSVGEATLVIQAADSLSGEVIYRAVDRRAAESVGGQMIRGNSAQTWGEVRRWARRWATRLREGLDSIHED